jgi:glutathione S-transferase
LTANPFAQKNLTSVIERYQNEIKRVSFVIDTQLKRAGTKYLVGDKLTYADLAFIPWYKMVLTTGIVPDWDYAKDYPAFAEWINPLLARESVKKVYDQKEFQRN